MKRVIAILIGLSMLLSGIPALAGGETVTMYFEDEAYNLTFDSAQIVDGALNVAVSGFGNVMHMRNGQIVIPFWAAASFDGDIVRAASVSCDSSGVNTYIFETDQMPDEIYLSPHGESDALTVIWADPDAEGGDVGGSEAGQSANTSSFEWLGHTFRAQFVSREPALINVGMGLLPSVGGYVMVRFACDAVPLSTLYENRENIVMLDASGEQLDDAAIRVNGVVLAEDTPREGTCDQFEAVFFLEEYTEETYGLITFELRGENGEARLPLSELSDRDYALFDTSVPEDQRDFTWVFEHMDGKNDAYKLLFAMCEARGNVDDTYGAALEYSYLLDIDDAFYNLCSEVVAAKKYNNPKDERLTYSEEHLLYAKTDADAVYRAHLIEAMDVSDELLDIMDDGRAQYGYRSVLWTDSALEGFFGKGLRTFVPDSPRGGVFLIALAPDTDLKPDMTSENDDGTGEGEAMRYAHDIADDLVIMFADREYTLTGNPNIASVLIEIDMKYVSAGRYEGLGTSITAYNCACTLRAYDMLNGQLIAQLTGTRSYGSTISTYEKSGTIWCSAPDMEEADGADAFTDAVFAHVPSTPIAQAETPIEASAPAVEAEPEREEPEAEQEQDMAREILALLDDPLYLSAYEYLEAGNFIRSGERSDNAKALQTQLVALGRDIKIDGQAGPKTIAAMNDVRVCLGMDKNDFIGAPCFEKVLACYLCVKDEDAAYDLLVGSMSEDEFTYLCACGFELTGQYYKAYQKYCLTGWEDANERAERCAQSWPKNGEVYRNSEYSSKKTYLHIKIDNQDEGQAALIKLYADNGDLVSCLFISGAGKVTAKIPGGTYTVKMGVGENWFGIEDAFGDEGYYQTMLFDDYADTVTLKSGYEYTLTINTSESDPTAEGVGSEHEDYENF